MQQEEYDMFKWDLNFLMLKDTEVIDSTSVGDEGYKYSAISDHEVRQPPSGQGAVGVRQTAGDGGV